MPLDENVLESSQEGLEMDVDSDQPACPSLGPVAVSSASPFVFLLLIYLQLDWCHICWDLAKIVYVCTKCQSRI